MKLFPKKERLTILVPDKTKEDTQYSDNSTSRLGSPGGKEKFTTFHSTEILRRTQRAVKRSIFYNRVMTPNKSNNQMIVEKGEEDDLNFVSKAKDGLKRLFSKHKTLNGGYEEIDRSSTTSSATKFQLNEKIEKAIHAKEKDITLKILNIIIGIFAVVSIVLMIGYLAVSNSNLSSVQNNVDILRASYDKIKLLIEVDRKVRLINLIQRGMIPAARTSPDDVSINLWVISFMSEDISLFNNQERSRVYQVGEQFQERFYAPIRITNTNDNNKELISNTFEATSFIVNSVLELSNDQPNKPEYNNSNVYFVLNNTLNDLLVQSAVVSEILYADNKIKFQSIKLINLVLLITVTAVALLIFIIMIKNEVNFTWKKDQFLEAFLRIDINEIDEILFLVKSFYSSLLETNKQDKFMETISKREFQNKAKRFNRKDQVKNFKTKAANPKGLNNSAYIKVLIASLILIIFSFGFLLLLAAFYSYNDTISASMSRLVKTDSYTTTNALVFAALYEYISEDASTMVKNQPIASNWEAEYNTLLGLAGYFNEFDNQSSNKEFNDNIDMLLTGDLCPLLFTERPCYIEGAGRASKGIIGMLEFMLQTTREVKDFYDSSEKTFENKTTALTFKDLLEAEYIHQFYIGIAFSEVTDVLRNLLFKTIQEFISFSLGVVVGSAILFSALVKFLWQPIIKRLQSDRNNFRGIFKLIPYNIIMNNKMLKNYLINNSKDILNSVRNII